MLKGRKEIRKFDVVLAFPIASETEPQLQHHNNIWRLNNNDILFMYVRDN